MIRGFYTVEEASQLSGLKINTLRDYANGSKSTLIRGRDYTVLRRYRFGRCQHKTVFTKRGIERLISRDFHVIKPANRKTKAKEHNIIARLQHEAESVNRGSYNTIESKLRRKQLRMIALADYLYSHPCTYVDCKCACHGLAYGEYSVESCANKEEK